MAIFEAQGYIGKGQRLWLEHKSRVQAIRDNQYQTPDAKKLQELESLHRYRREVAAVEAEAKAEANKTRRRLLDSIVSDSKQQSYHQRQLMKGNEGALALLKIQLDGMSPTQLLKRLDTSYDEAEQVMILAIGAAQLRKTTDDSYKGDEFEARLHFMQRVDAPNPDIAKTFKQLDELAAAEGQFCEINVESRADYLAQHFNVSANPDAVIDSRNSFSGFQKHEPTEEEVAASLASSQAAQ